MTAEEANEAWGVTFERDNRRRKPKGRDAVSASTESVNGRCAANATSSNGRST